MSNTLLVYTPKYNKGQKIVYTNIISDVTSICGGFEIVNTRILHNILPGSVFICNDDFYNTPNQHKNSIGSLLYGTGYEILGTICIAKSIQISDGNNIVGFTAEEIKILENALSLLIEIHEFIDKTYAYTGFSSNIHEESILLKSYVFEVIQSMYKDNEQPVLNDDKFSIACLESYDWLLQFFLNDSACDMDVAIKKSTWFLNRVQKITKEIQHEKENFKKA